MLELLERKEREVNTEKSKRMREERKEAIKQARKQARRQREVLFLTKTITQVVTYQSGILGIFCLPRNVNAQNMVPGGVPLALNGGTCFPQSHRCLPLAPRCRKPEYGAGAVDDLRALDVIYPVMDSWGRGSESGWRTRGWRSRFEGGRFCLAEE